MSAEGTTDHYSFEMLWTSKLGSASHRKQKETNHSMFYGLFQLGIWIVFFGKTRRFKHWRFQFTELMAVTIKEAFLLHLQLILDMCTAHTTAVDGAWKIPNTWISGQVPNYHLPSGKGLVITIWNITIFLMGKINYEWVKMAKTLSLPEGIFLMITTVLSGSRESLRSGRTGAPLTAWGVMLEILDAQICFSGGSNIWDSIWDRMGPPRQYVSCLVSGLTMVFGLTMVCGRYKYSWWGL